MRIRYNILQNDNWVSRNKITGPSTNYSLVLNPREGSYLITGDDGSTLSGEGNSIVELKKSVRFGLSSLGVQFEVEKRNRKKMIDAFDLDTHANLAAKVD